MIKKTFYFLFLLLMTANATPLQAAKKKMFSSEAEAKQYMLYHYNKGVNDYNELNWRDACDEFEKVVRFFPESEVAPQASFYLGVSYFERYEYDFANCEFSAYLKSSEQPEYFEETLYYKFCIAEHLKYNKRRPFTVRYLPKWLEGQSLALEIYDELIACVPNHELAIKALYSKATLLQTMREYRESIESYQLLIRRFPKDELTPASYLRISQAYYQLSQLEFQNPDLLALADVNARKFRENFPRDERVAQAENYSLMIKEVYAKGLCSVGQFYERTHHPDAAAIYYQSAIEDYPNTHVATYCRLRMNQLNYNDEEKAKVIPLRAEQQINGPMMLDPQKMYEPTALPLNDFDDDDA